MMFVTKAMSQVATIRVEPAVTGMVLRCIAAPEFLFEVAHSVGHHHGLNLLLLYPKSESL